MRFRHAVPALYWIAIGFLLLGALLLLVAGDDHPDLGHVGEVITGIAWPVAAVGAALDTIRHQRPRRAPAPDPDEDQARTLRSEP